MRIRFATEEAAGAALEIWKRHGFSAARRGATVTTNCPTLWAVSVIDRHIGFDKVLRFDVVTPSTDGPVLSGEPCGEELRHSGSPLLFEGQQSA
jgi:hypothetical protein